MSTKIDCNSSKLMDILSDDILSSIKCEETSDSLLMLLPEKDYRLLISCSELMSSVFQKLLKTNKNNFVIYPNSID